MFKAGPLEVMKKARGHYEDILEYCRSPKALLKYMDSIGIERAVLINYVAPETMGFTHEVNPWVANYCKENPKRLLSCGSVHPRHTLNVQAEMDNLVRLGIRLIKIHPPHQMLYANDYLNGVKELEIVYRAAEANGIPVMIHTGTSIFPAARNKFGDPIYLDDVAVDFPKLKILMAHGGRPIWMQTAFFLLRRHKNVHLDISGIPPKILLKYFPRLEEIAHKTLFGTDWPSPGIPDIKQNLDQFQALALPDPVKEQILEQDSVGDVAGVAPCLAIDGCAPDCTFLLPKKQTGPEVAGPDSQFSAMLDRCASSGHQMPDDRDHGKDQKQVNQAAGDVKSGEPENPKHEQNNTDKQKHVVPPMAKFVKAFRLPASRIQVHHGPLHH